MDQKDILAITEAIDTKFAPTLQKVDTGIATIGSKLESQLAEFNETAKKVLVPKPEDIKTAEELKAEEKAKLEQAGAVAGIMDIKVWDIPVGQAAVGGFVAVFASELIDGFLVERSPQTKGIVKLIGAGVAVKWGGRFLGSTGSKAVALLLAYDGVRMLLPIDQWAHGLSTKVSGVIPTGGLAGNIAGGGSGGGNGHKSADPMQVLRGV